jgi:DNA polymerase (family X)
MAENKKDSSDLNSPLRGTGGMDNYAIADQLSMLAKLMDIHGENSFKTKSYSVAAFTIEKLPQELSSLAAEKIFSIKGIGESVGKKIIELLDKGELPALREIISKTPEGVLEMMNIKGLGPKKINTLWKEYGIDTIEDLKKACLENKIAEKKGFGEKTQEKILESIQFQQQSEGKYLYAQISDFVELFSEKLRTAFPDNQILITGEYRRQLEIIEKLEWVTTTEKESLKKFLLNHDFVLISESDNSITVSAAEQTIQLQFHLANEDSFQLKQFKTSCSKEFLTAWEGPSYIKTASPKTEEEIFEKANLSYIPPFLRETASVLIKAQNKTEFSNLIQPSEIKGLIHSHSNWSDGAYTIEQMAEELIKLGFEYLVISDHSKAAYYANGLTEEKIKAQHIYIDELNRKFAPFKIYKSIECDILSDGSLDYSNKVLATFDLVIASIHSNLDMDEEKAMQRLMGAIKNPYVTILGHMTGRRLLKRRGYPVDHKTIINACATHDVVIEINSSPQRLDIDWRWIDYALEKGLMLSINPDAHSIDEFQYIKYGALVGQKGGLTKERNLSSFHREEFEAFLLETKKAKGII